MLLALRRPASGRRSSPPSGGGATFGPIPHIAGGAVRHKIDLGSGLVALGALGVLVSLFLDWYAPHLTAFDAFEVVDWALAALAVVTVAGLSLATRDAVPIPPWLVVAVLAAAVLVAAQVIDPPPAAHGAGRESGAWL